MHLGSLLVLSVFFAACASSSGATSATSEDTAPIVVTSDGGARLALVTTPLHPPPPGIVAFDITVDDASGAPVSDLDLTLAGWMPSHGHASYGNVVVTNAGQGHYHVEGCVLAMAGSWQIRTTLRDPSGHEDHATATLEVR